ncbi:MAG: TerB family tellurite resistance protein [Mariprofundaceae bacterium]
MLSKIKALFTDSAKVESTHKKHDISLAVTAMMIEIMNIDGKLEAVEHNEIINAIERRFGLSNREVEMLIEDAKHARNNSADLHQFTSLIIDCFSMEERIDFLKELWQIAMVDGSVDPYEEQLIRRISGLIGVYHGDFIQAKIQARENVRGVL